MKIKSSEAEWLRMLMSPRSALCKLFEVQRNKRQLGTKLAGKIVVYIANPLNSTYGGLATAPDSSSARMWQKRLLPGQK